MQRRAVYALMAAALSSSLPACGDGEADSGNPAVEDPAGKAACEEFRAIAADANAETASRRQIVSRLPTVGELAADSTDKKIRQFGARVAEEANARTLISGAPNKAQDVLADTCNARFPL